MNIEKLDYELRTRKVWAWTGALVMAGIIGGAASAHDRHIDLLRLREQNASRYR